jgi:Mg2+/Co2+ transporter CorB
MLITALIVLLLIICSAFFAAAETALTATSRSMMFQMEQEGDQRAGIVNRLLKRRERLISTILLVNTTVNILASALTTEVMIEAFGERGVAYATGLMTALLLIYAEILPKTFGLLHTTATALKVARVMSAFVWICTPFNIAAQWVVNGTMRMFGVRTDHSRTPEQILSELRGTIELHMGEKDIREEVRQERAMLRSVLDLSEVTIGEIMTHRKRTVTIDADLPVQEIMDQMATSPYSRIPLWRGEPDNVVGILHAKALLRAAGTPGLDFGKVDVVALAAAPWFIPDTTTLQDQLHAFRARREHFALVVDEYGTLLGVVTLEDILEEIVGDIRDEHDVPVAGVRVQADGSYLIDGAVTLRDLNREFDWRLSDDKASTLAGLVLHESRTIPGPGQKFMFHGFRFEVLRRNRNQLTLIRVTPPRAKSRDQISSAA